MIDIIISLISGVLIGYSICSIFRGNNIRKLKRKIEIFNKLNKVLLSDIFELISKNRNLKKEISSNEKTKTRKNSKKSK